MALDDLKTFMEDRLRAFDPSIDLEPGSPAQVQFIEPVLARLGTDPFQTDIDKFITDRFAQEFPDVYAGEPGVVRDTFIKPLIVLLEPFKREIQTLKSNQSMKDPTLLSDEDADALAANVFEDRDSGGFSVGTGRAFYPNPTNAQAEITTRFFTGEGLSYYPVSPVAITAEEMVFNRSGNLFYFDVPLKAEKEGSDYNIDENQLSGVDGLFGVVKVANLRAFKSGASKLDTPTFVATAKESLTERSLVTRRGASARIRQVFQTDLRAAQIIGARDPEMQRDILVAVGPGHAWLTGSVSLYQKIAFVQCSTVDGAESDIPVPEDTLYVYLNKYDFPAVQQGLRTQKFVVEEVLSGPIQVNTDPYQLAYLVRWSGSPSTGITIPDGSVLDGGFIKKGEVRISSLPDVGPVSFSVPSGDVHVYGHSDIYARPILQTTDKAVLSGLYDSTLTSGADASIQRTTLTTNGSDLTNKNRITDPGFDFLAAGVEAGDICVLESSEDAGSYVVMKVTGGSPSYLYLSSSLTKSRTGIRYRILKRIKIDPFEPKIMKFPFGSALANDLQTTIGSALLKLSTNDLLSYSVKNGDVLRVLTGADPKDYTITGFDPVLGGKGVLVDQAASATESALQYQVFTALESVARPLVRVKEVMLLDSAQQTTGVTIPPADPIAVVPTCDFTSARVRGGSQGKTGYVLPDLVSEVGLSFFTASNQAAPAVGGTVVTSDRRYSMGFDTATGYYKGFFTDNGGAQDYFEFDIRADAQTGCNYFISVIEFSDETENFPPIDPRPGECLTLKSGPNKGSYLIKAVHKQKYRLYSPARTAWVYFIQIYGSFPVDVFRELIKFLNDAGGAAAVVELPISTGIEFPTFFSDLYASFGTKLHSALLSYGATSPGASVLQSMVDSISQVDYEWGDPARGVLRSYFLEPVLFQQSTGEADNPTLFEFQASNGDVLQFRADPNRYTKQELIPARLTQDTEPILYPRDLDASVIGQATFVDTSKPTVFKSGIRAGDALSVHEEVFFHDNSKLKRTAVQTLALSNQITDPNPSGGIFTPSMVGNLLFVEQGADIGGYRVVKYLDARNILIDKPLSVSTPPITVQGSLGSWGYDGAKNKIVSGTAVLFENYVNMYVTIYGMDYSYQGSYKILSDVGTTGTTAILDRVGNFPAVVSESAARWVITAAPPDPLATELTGTILYGLQAIRMYQSIPEDVAVLDVTFNDTSISRLTFTGSLVDGLFQPYRLYRKNIRRVTPEELSENVEGPFSFFDTEVVSLAPQSTANLLEKVSYLTMREGSYYSEGYRHLPDDPNLTYSTKESGKIEFPASILPVGSEDSPDNYLSLVGAPIQISYNSADVVRLLQEFLDSTEDRVTTANMLARHFLPAYVSYDATYVGGSAASVIAADIIAYLDTIPVEQPVDTSLLEKLITDRGGNPLTPTKAMVVIHDWDRKAWLEFSENEVGGSSTEVPYNGTPRVSYFLPGPDVSGATSIPSGERVNLTRR